MSNTEELQYAKKERRIILAPIITEKSAKLVANKCYTFQVDSLSNKDQISQEFTRIFKGKVLRINTVAERYKLRKTKRGSRRKHPTKKAYIFTDIELDIFPKVE